jgi:hypothetical protein
VTGNVRLARPASGKGGPLVQPPPKEGSGQADGDTGPGIDMMVGALHRATGSSRAWVRR